MVDRAFLILPAVQKVGQNLSSYKEFPPRQRPASISLDQVMEALEVREGGGRPVGVHGQPVAAARLGRGVL